MIILDLDNPASFGAIDGSARLKYQNLSAAILEFDVVCPELNSPSPYAYKQEIKGVRGGQTMITGVVESCKRQHSGDKYIFRVTIKDRWFFLDGCVYLGRGDGDEMNSSLLANICNPRFREGGKVGIVNYKQVVEIILKAAQKSKCLTDYEINVDDKVKITEFSASGTYGQMLRKVKASRPNILANFDHLSGGTKFILADQDRALSVTLDVKTNNITELDINPMPELVPPAVGIIAVSSAKSVATYQYPQNADITQPGCVISQTTYPEQSPPEEEPPEENKKKGIQKDQWNFTRGRMMVKGVKLPTDDSSGRKWWADKLPIFKDRRWAGVLMDCRFGETEKEIVEVDKDDAYSETATSHEFISGTIAQKCKTIKWCEIIFRQRIEIYGGDPPPEWATIFTEFKGEKHWAGWLTWRGKTINTSRRTYSEGCDYNNGDDEQDDYPKDPDPSPFKPELPDYLAVCKSLWEATQTLQWGGSLTMLDPPENIADLVGHTLNITSATPEMTSMATIIQTITLDLFSCAASLTCGAAEHLSLDDMLERARAISEQQQKTAQNSSSNNDDDNRPGMGSNDMDFTWDPNARRQPKSPTVAPGGHIVPGEIAPAPEFGFQVRIIRDKEGRAINSMMRHGSIINSDGSIMSSREGGSQNNWVSTGIKAGQIWIKLGFSGGAKYVAGKYQGMSIQSAGGANSPFLTSYDPSESEIIKDSVYYFHIASISDTGIVTQFILGSVYLLTKAATAYVYGPI